MILIPRFVTPLLFLLITLFIAPLWGENTSSRHLQRRKLSHYGPPGGWRLPQRLSETRI